jgi:hypothetical protein
MREPALTYHASRITRFRAAYDCEFSANGVIVTFKNG